jgi:hypothetical protein
MVGMAAIEQSLGNMLGSFGAHQALVVAAEIATQQQATASQVPSSPV